MKKINVFLLLIATSVFGIVAAGPILANAGSVSDNHSSSTSSTSSPWSSESRNHNDYNYNNSTTTPYNAMGHEGNYGGQGGVANYQYNIGTNTISNVDFADITGTSAVVTWNTSMPSNGVVIYSTSRPVVLNETGISTAESASWSRNHSVNLTGLAPDTTYYFRVRARDSGGNVTRSGLYSFSTNSSSSTTPPPSQPFDMTGVTANASTTTSVISWDTSTSTLGTVTFGTSSTTLSNSMPESGSMSTTHQVTLTGLAPGTTYYYNISSNDADNDTVQSGVLSFDTMGTGTSAAFQITDVSASASTTSAIISWNTDQPTLGSVLFGTDSTTLGSNMPESGSMSTTHQVTLTGLSPGTMYFYAINTQDASSTVEQSSTMSFDTAAATTTVDPNIVFLTNIGTTTATTNIIWVTDQASDSNAWVDTTSPVSTSTTPVASNSGLVYFHELSIPNLATSTPYFYTISSTNSSGNTGYGSGSFTTPSI